VVKTTGVELFCYHRDRPRLCDAARGFAGEALVLHGPVPGPDDRPRPDPRRWRHAHRQHHIVDLPGPAAARAFAFDEPGYQAGVYRNVLLRRWRNTLGRTMWDFPAGRAGGSRYLVIGQQWPVGDQLVPAGQVSEVSGMSSAKTEHLSTHGMSILLSIPGLQVCPNFANLLTK
jgi:hypothetical protein